MLNYRYLLAALALPLANMAWAACADLSAADVARDFHRQHANFHYTNPASIQPLLAPPLYVALTREYRCSSKGELCAIEADPWTDAQDGEIKPPIHFRTIHSTPTDADVEMRYLFALGTKQRHPQAMHIRLSRPAGNACWQIADLISPRGASLSHQIEQWHQRYGKQQ